jgi:hypothetical protein
MGVKKSLAIARLLNEVLADDVPVADEAADNEDDIPVEADN